MDLCLKPSLSPRFLILTDSVPTVVCVCDSQMSSGTMFFFVKLLSSLQCFQFAGQMKGKVSSDRNSRPERQKHPPRPPPLPPPLFSFPSGSSAFFVPFGPRAFLPMFYEGP